MYVCTIYIFVCINEYIVSDAAFQLLNKVSRISLSPKDCHIVNFVNLTAFLVIDDLPM